MKVHTLDLSFLDIPQAIAAFLVEAGDTHILIETGPYSTIRQLEGSLQALGKSAAKLDAVLVTHIHLDHAGAAWYFAQKGIPVYMHPIGAPHMADPSKLLQSAQRIYGDQMERLWGTLKPIPEACLHTVSHGEELHIGNCRIKAWHTPGHAIHHVAWQIENHLFTGDVAGVRIGGSLVVPPCPPPDIDVEAWDQSIEILRRQAPGQLLLTHFGAYTDVQAHLQELQERLHAWADWMRPHAETGRPAQEIVPLFQDFVHSQLRAAGLNEQQIARYEAANPSFMSVAGLLRYWKKKFEKQKTENQ